VSGALAALLVSGGAEAIRCDILLEREAAPMDRRIMLAGVVGAPLVTALTALSETVLAGPALADSGHSSGAPAKFKVNIPAGPLWSNDLAQKLGPAIAAAHFGTFTGQWATVIPGQMSVIEVELPAQPAGAVTHTMDVPAGPIWNNDDAKAKCPAICASYGGTWNGQWATVIPGKLSVAGCTFKL